MAVQSYLNLCTHSCVSIISRQQLPWCMTSLWTHIMWLSCDIMWHVTSCDRHVTSCDRHVTSCDIMWCHVASCDIMWHVTDMWHHVTCDRHVPYGCVLHYRAHREQWIRAKYERREFIPGAPPPPYLGGQSISDLIIQCQTWNWRQNTHLGMGGRGGERRFVQKLPKVCYLDICCSILVSFNNVSPSSDKRKKKPSKQWILGQYKPLLLWYSSCIIMKLAAICM